MLSRDKLTWKNNELFRYGSPDPLAKIVPDGKYPQMWRIAMPNRKLSDMVNLSRAKDAAASLAISAFNSRV